MSILRRAGRAASLGLLLVGLAWPAFAAASERPSDAKPGDGKPAPQEPKPAEPASPPAAATEAASPAPAALPGGKTVEQLAEQLRKSVVVVTVSGRDGTQQGLGSGFVISHDGLIVTNLHVIGEARPITVQFADGKTFSVQTVHASDRTADLALVKIDAKNLPALEVADSDKLKDGQAVVAVGNPHGLRHSVVSGVVSGRREIDGRQMIQLAIPIEPGNSGGPLVDMLGRVHGILTMKSNLTNNLGFAVASNSLRPLLDKPNPIPMARWLTIGNLDPKEWSVVGGGRWRQRAGRIQAGGQGSGFGGRSLCLSSQPLPKLPYEVAVTVKLDDEAGAAGLAFASDGGDVHYGFYPSGGKLRLTRFEGPDVTSWTILSNESSPHYKPGGWNALKVRIEEKQIICFVNDQQTLAIAEHKLAGGKVGLAKFRNMEAEFKNFRIGAELKPATVSTEALAGIDKLLAALPAQGALPADSVATVAPAGAAGLQVLRERAAALDRQAEQLRKLATEVHRQTAIDELAAHMKRPDEEIDLVRAGLLIARLDNEEVDVEAYLTQFERLARELRDSSPKEADEATRLAALNKHLFQELGFHGSRQDYDNQANSYLNEVLDDREGLPITLSLVYMELARRLDLNVVGIGLPGHFVVQHRPKQGEPQLLDVFENAKTMSRAEADAIFQAASDRSLKDDDLRAAGKRDIVVRMLHNLRSRAKGAQDPQNVLRYLDAVLAFAPETMEDRSLRCVVRAQLNDKPGALADIDFLLDKQPAGIDLDRLRQFRELVERREE